MSRGPVVLGRVSGAHGVEGQIRVRFLGDGPENLLAASRLILADAELGESDPSPREVEVEQGGRGRPGEVRLRLRGVADRDAAEALQGAWVLTRSESLLPLAPGEHYWFELVGCRVETTDGQPLGTVRELWDIGPHDVLVVVDESGGRRLIPTAGPAVAEIHEDERRIVVEPLPGLLEPT